jgi:hypothetical protein
MSIGFLLFQQLFAGDADLLDLVALADRAQGSVPTRGRTAARGGMAASDKLTTGG